jgi:hypothetical protein
MPRKTTLLILLAALFLGMTAAASAKRFRVKKPARGMQIMVGPIAVPQGSERTSCTYLSFPGKKDVAVNKVRIKVRGGSHHIHLYRPYDDNARFPDHEETCDFALDFDVWQLILASQNIDLTWKLPKGVAFHFNAGEQLLAQTHFVDNGLLEAPEEGWAAFNLHTVPERKVESYAGALFGQDRDVVVTPGTSTATTKCVFPRPVKLLALTGHYHFRGVEFTVNTWDGQNTGEQLYSFEGYTEPAFRRYGGAEGNPEVLGLEWTCTYENPSDETYTFGPFTDRNEHCNLFGFYYPTLDENEFMTCVQTDGVVTVEAGS